MPTVDQPRLSVVIPAYNNASPLAVTLESLTRQSIPSDEFEVIVGDDGSEVPLGPLVDRFADRLRVVCVRQEQNRGRSANRNLGAARARARTLLFLDSDTVAHPQLLKRHLAFHGERSGRPGVLLGARFEVDWAGADALRRGAAVAPAMLDAERGDPRLEDIALPQRRDDLRRAPWVLGLTHNSSVDRASFDSVGGFDEAMVKWGLEDLEFFYRVFHRHGGPPDLFHLDAEAHSYHLPHFRETSNSFASMDNMKYVLRKHPRYDIEVLYALRSFGRHIGRVRLYGDALDACRAAGLGRPSALPPQVRDAMVAQPTLAVGFGVATMPLGEASQTFDHEAPLGPTNSHLFGLALQQFKTAQLGLIVNIDLWRFLLPEDLWALVLRGLRKARQLALVATRAPVDQAALLPVPFIADVDYVAEMLSPHVRVELSRHDAASVLTIR